MAWFYKAPEDNDLEFISQKFHRYILTHGNEDVRDELVRHGAKGPFLEYLRFEAILDPGDCSREPWKNQVAYNTGDFCRISAEHPDWFLLDTNGERIVHEYQDEKFYLMDPGNAGWRAFWLDRARQVQEKYNWDGVFLDNVEVSLMYIEKDDVELQDYPNEAAYLQAVQGFLKYMYTEYFHPEGKLLYANLIGTRDESVWPLYTRYLDGAMHEGWSVDWPDRWRDPEKWEAQLKLAEDTLAAGKFMFLVSQGKENDHELQEFAFASYLLINNGNAAFRYANSREYRFAWLYDNYGIKIGSPLGPRYKVGDAWYRDYSNGFVMVNPKTHEVKISINGSTGAND